MCGRPCCICGVVGGIPAFYSVVARSHSRGTTRAERQALALGLQSGADETGERAESTAVQKADNGSRQPRAYAA